MRSGRPDAVVVVVGQEAVAAGDARLAGVASAATVVIIDPGDDTRNFARRLERLEVVVPRAHRTE